MSGFFVYFNISAIIQFASPTTGISTLTFLLIAHGSISMCMIFACGANSSILPVTLSSNLAPTAIIRSDSWIAWFAYAVPCMPSIPSESSCVPGNAPSPISVMVTGIPVFSTNSRSFSEAPEIITPPPT